MLIKGLQKLTLLDYPGKVAMTIFLFGCNFRCPYCHNPELVLSREEEKTHTYKESEILEFLHERKNFLEGVCITGGEPTLSPELPEFIRKIKDMSYKVKLDTNGTNPNMLKELISQGLVDYIAMDIKAPLIRYSEVVNAKIDRNKIKESIDIIKKFPNHEFRTTVVPGLITKQDIVKIAEMLKGSKAFYLQQFRPENCLDKRYNRKKTYGKEELEEFKKEMKPYFKKVEIRHESY
jgi:pyruvate formate lyase activating enzyme